MNPSRRRITAAGLFGLAGASSWSALAQDKGDKVYRFSPVNQYGIELTARYWNPIIDYVSRRSGVKLHLKIGRTSADTTAFVVAGEVHFVFSNHLFSPERERLGWVTFGRRDTAPIYGQIAVLADSPIQRLEDLADQQVAFPGPEALVAYTTNTVQRTADVEVSVVPDAVADVVDVLDQQPRLAGVVTVVGDPTLHPGEFRIHREWADADGTFDRYLTLARDAMERLVMADSA